MCPTPATAKNNLQRNPYGYLCANRLTLRSLKATSHKALHITLLHKATVLFTILLLSAGQIYAQQQPGAPLGLPGDKKQDSLAFDKSNTDEWHSENANVKVRYKYLHSEKSLQPDSSIHTFHRRKYLQPWYTDLGNYGSPARNLMFTPENRFGPTLGYNLTDVFHIQPDSLKFYNTTVPYSVFSFNLGSKLEQKLEVLHTQNIKPNWNFAIEYNRLSSEGYFLLQRNVHDMGSVTTNYQSVNRRYKLKAGLIYNKSIQDENGGIADETQLTNEDFNERSTLDINYANAVSQGGSSVPRSLITNSVRDYHIIVQHGYSWGKTDSLYNEDSTKISVQYTPRFGISHHFRHSNKQYTYKDMRPDSLRYAPFFTQSFAGDGSDSVFTRQKQNTFDNALLLNGFIGKGEKQVQFSAGAGIRVDNFSTRFLIDAQFYNIASSYLSGQLRKEALEPGEWFYSASAKFYVTGAAAGNSLLQASAGKELGDWAIAEACIQQNINNAAYSYTTYINHYDTISNTFNKESVTQAFVRFSSNKYALNAIVRTYLISNYLYMNTQQLPDQYAPAFNITQISLQKAFRWRGLVLDNELLYQQVAANTPVNIPQLMGRHQFGYEGRIFRNALEIATGLQIQYHSPYNSAAYSPLFHRYYYYTGYRLSNDPAYAFFFNFRIKRFRSYLMLDQLQQLFGDKKNFINAPGYPAQNTMIRFGFNWTLLR